MHTDTTEEEYIRRGDAAWKQQDWKLCLDNYTEALRLNPTSTARTKREMVMDIIAFFHKDRLNP